MQVSFNLIHVLSPNKYRYVTVLWALFFYIMYYHTYEVYLSLLRFKVAILFLSSKMVHSNYQRYCFLFWSRFCWSFLWSIYLLDTLGYILLVSLYLVSSLIFIYHFVVVKVCNLINVIQCITIQVPLINSCKL